jgi:hypothetical protein
VEYAIQPTLEARQNHIMEILTVMARIFIAVIIFISDRVLDGTEGNSCPKNQTKLFDCNGLNTYWLVTIAALLIRIGHGGPPFGAAKLLFISKLALSLSLTPIIPSSRCFAASPTVRLGATDLSTTAHLQNKRQATIAFYFGCFYPLASIDSRVAKRFISFIF